MVYLGTDSGKHVSRLASGHDKVLIRVSVDALFKHGLPMYLTGRGDILCGSAVPVSCFMSAAQWTQGTLKVIWLPSDGPPPGGSGGPPRPGRAASRADKASSASPGGGLSRRRQPWVLASHQTELVREAHGDSGLGNPMSPGPRRAAPPLVQTGARDRSRSRLLQGRA